MDIKIQFNNNLVDLIQLIRKKNKHLKPLINEYYVNYSAKLDTSFIEFVVSFNKCLTKYSNDIIKCDEMLFSNDISTDGVFILDGIDFKLFWKNFEEEDKLIVWKKLKMLYTLSIYILKTTNEYKSLYSKQQEIMATLIDGLTQKHDLEQEIKRQKEEQELEDKINFEDIRSKFGDNIFTDIIIEIIKELNLDKNVNTESLVGLLKEFTNNDENSVNPLIDNIINKVKQKLVERNMTEDELYAELATVKDKFNDFFKGIPQFSDLIDKLTSEAKNIIDTKLNSKNSSNPSNSSKENDDKFKGFEEQMEILKGITSKIEEIELTNLFK